MRVEVDPSRCQGHTPCAMIAPESFVLDDVDGHAQAIVVMVEHLAQARAAHGRRGTTT
ncbi:ferredoxin [Mycolicibacterium sp. GCM10028919]|uniref:ferredoxin n=1 Tax=Mycolicibacterium sp. GCM10028919 TaxID=3273401 RepID=UPI0036233311